MSPVNCGSHKDYQDFVVKNLHKHYPRPDYLARSTWNSIERFWHIDLSSVDTSLVDKYSSFVPSPRTHSCMLRSYLLSIEFNISSITQWATHLKLNPLFAILSGFEFDDSPSVSTFYDFLIGYGIPTTVICRPVSIL